MQRKVNRSDSDYHYDKEKYKRNVYKMMLECKQKRGNADGDINDYSCSVPEGLKVGNKDGI